MTDKHSIEEKNSGKIQEKQKKTSNEVYPIKNVSFL